MPTTPLRGGAARAAMTMAQSRALPTATIVAEVPARVLVENRLLINEEVAGKVSLTHLIGYAVARACVEVPEVNHFFGRTAGGTAVCVPPGVNLGVLVDVRRPDGTRAVRAPCVRDVQTLSFAGWRTAYDELVASARNATLSVSASIGTTISITNPGLLGTSHSVPLLMPGQGAVIGVGAVQHPPALAGVAAATLAALGVSETVHVTITFDLRAVGAFAAKQFLEVLQGLLTGRRPFYGDVFDSLEIAARPYRWQFDRTGGRPDPVACDRLIRSGRADLSGTGLTVWDLARPCLGPAGRPPRLLREVLYDLRHPAGPGA